MLSPLPQLLPWHPAPAALLRLVVRGARRQIPAARRNLATSHCPAQILEDLGDRLVSGAVWQFQACHLERLFGLGKSMFSRLGKGTSGDRCGRMSKTIPCMHGRQAQAASMVFVLLCFDI